MPGHLNSFGSITYEYAGHSFIQHFHYAFSEECPAGSLAIWLVEIEAAARAQALLA
ncbi:hypothetical protein [Sinorhizobium meliloti]|uniref:hypothetical protein n=1 Tax=Rhizobium meliloti TaxID=382 RepID=UPI0012BBD04A|nr:hypothetical protein [Sinorhizobium meliloti]UFX07249.1 hypothetical protein SmelRRI128_12305 [Sinorhizobium meliloti]